MFFTRAELFIASCIRPIQSLKIVQILVEELFKNVLGEWPRLLIQIGLSLFLERTQSAAINQLQVA
jgi:hypothetical protein